jgi:dienelactone hydrolase
MIKTLLIRTVLILCFLSFFDENGVSQNVNKEIKWQKIAPYFASPVQFKEQYGSYRSPLKFYDGREVKNSSDWKKRRIEILDRWNGLMGKWPALITNQKLQFLDSVRKDGFTQYQVRFDWVPGQKTNGYLLVPHGKGKMPAVITVYYEPETAAGLGRPDLPDRDFAYQLCKRGFVTLSLGTTESTNSKTYSIYYPGIQNASVQPLSMLAYAAANAWNVLAKVQYVDSERIGIMGHSYGGKWAMFASSLYEKFACAVWSDPGIVFEDSRESINYWEPWYLGYHPQPWRKRGLITYDNPASGLYPKLVSEGYNLQELHVLMAPRPFLVSGGSEDPVNRWISLNHSVAVNDLLGYKNRVAMTNRPEHTPNPESNELAYSFLEYYLKK